MKKNFTNTNPASYLNLKKVEYYFLVSAGGHHSYLMSNDYRTHLKYPILDLFSSDVSVRLWVLLSLPTGQFSEI